MKKLLLLLIPLSCFAGDPPLEVGVSFNTYWAARKAPITGYTKINASYEWLRGYFDSTFHVPNGTTPGLNGGYNHAGALYYKTGDSSLYVYTGTQWRTVSGSGSTPTWQNTLLTSGGSEITTSIDVEGNGNGFNFQNFGDFNINTNGGLGLSFNNGIYGSGSITHNTGAIGFDIYHNAAGEESQVYFGAGRLWMLHGIKTKFEVKTDTATVEADNFRINIPSAGAGKILVSNANGNATWQTPAPSGRFGYPGEDYSAGEHRDFNMHDTYQMTFDSLAGFVVKNSGRNRIYMDGTSTALFSPSISGSNAAGFVSTNGVARIYQGLSNQILLRGDTTVAIQRISYNSNIASTFTPYSLVTKKYVDSTVSSVSVTPPGNYGNVQLNRNGAFATPASDSLSFSSAALNVKGAISMSDNQYLKIGGSNILHFNTGSNNATFAGAYNFLFNNGGNVFMNSANTTYFSTSTGDLYFSGSGKLGIGTASPGGPLHVKANAGAIDALFVDGTTGNVGIGTATPSVALDVVGNIHGTGATTLDLSGTGLNVLVGGEIQLFIDNTNGDWILGDAANAFSNKVRISGDNAGDIISLDAATVKFVNYGAGAATFDASGNISSVSDVRLKNVQGGYSVGLSALMNIKPIVYKWNEKSKMETKHNYIGFSAQNILSALGQDATGINKDGYLSIQDRAIMATMVVAIQEQQKMIETLQKEIKKLKRK